MFEMLTGQLPFSASSPEELARLHREVPPPSPRKLNPAIPAQLEQILLKVLSKEPSARYRTADQLGRVLVTFTQQSNTVEAVPTPKFPKVAEEDATQPMTAEAESEFYPTNSTYTPPEPQYAPLDPPFVRVEPAAYSLSRPAENPLDIDWATWALGLLALIAVGGLIPFCLWVYYVLNPPF